jgi:hypothetical protein
MLFSRLLFDVGELAQVAMEKKKPRGGGAYWSLACLFVEECFSSCSYIDAVLDAPLA